MTTLFIHDDDDDKNAPGNAPRTFVFLTMAMTVMMNDLDNDSASGIWRQH
jgi:hypothetical protein